MSPGYPEVMPSRTTFRLDEELLAEAKAQAARQRRSLNSVMEEALRRWLAVAQELATRPPVELTTSGTPGGGPHLTPEDIKEILEQQDIEHFLEVSADDARGHERDGLRPSA
jgi:Ribbon-helix-helix protein, copG family